MRALDGSAILRPRGAPQEARVVADAHATGSRPGKRTEYTAQDFGAEDPQKGARDGEPLVAFAVFSTSKQTCTSPQSASSERRTYPAVAASGAQTIAGGRGPTKIDIAFPLIFSPINNYTVDHGH